MVKAGRASKKMEKMEDSLRKSTTPPWEVMEGRILLAADKGRRATREALTKTQEGEEEAEDREEVLVDLQGV
jgi:hypothetical protein